MQSRTNVHFLVFHLTLADAIVCFITMPMETIWRVVIEVFALQNQRKQEVLLAKWGETFNHSETHPYHASKLMYKRSWKIPPAVVRGEPCVQGVDDGEDRRLYSLLLDAHCALHRQVGTLKISRWQSNSLALENNKISKWQSSNLT